MDLKCLPGTPCVLTLVSNIYFFNNSRTQISIMHVGFIILTPILICLWIYILILLKDTFASKPSTSIELNIIDAKDIVNNFNTKTNSSEYNSKSVGTSRKKKTVHVPKFMLELYEKNKSGRKSKERPDVVRSLIPTDAGSFPSNEIYEQLSDNHLLVFSLPALNKDEIFIGAELKILTLLDFNANHEKALLPSVSNDLKLSLMPVKEDIQHDYPVLLLYFSIKEDEGYTESSANRKIDKNRKKRSIEDDYEEETNKVWDDD
ncbi:hypothetical protein NQ317_012734 [Molorchus minor]|uniref:Uncharacterized protein n=1 Tax=Molorchus minor TaxID=1323400 RepID=A0ABQ9JM26_9CUCU|nr:hypothetical protein NQ317_012734 [Molorchus minor]